MAGRAAEQGLEVVCRIDPGLPVWRHGDDLRLRQVLINLLGNAVKFTSKGHVSLQVGAGPGGEVQFSVSDTGIGIGDAERARIFQPFEQADSSSSRRFGGTGLGLAISRALVSAMGGTLTLDAAGAQPGSTFRFALPLAVSQQPAPPRPAPLAAVAGLHVLVIDDLAESRAALTEQLQALGLRADSVADGASALDRVAAADAAGDGFALCLVDWRLPDTDGIRLVQRLRALPLRRHPVHLLATAFGTQLPDSADGQAPTRVLDKPIALLALQRALTDALGLGQSETAARPAPQPPEQQLRQRAGCRLLLVEDNPLNQEVALQLLHDAGLQAEVACDGQAALERVQGHHFDLVLMDVHMPRLDGLAATRAIRALPAGATLPILAMTAGAMTEDRAQCIDAGMNDVITKPVDPDHLYTTLLRWLPAGGARPPVPALPAAAGPSAAGPQPLPQVPGLDTATGLRLVGGRPQVYLRLLRRFVEHHAPDADQLRQAALRGATDEIRRLCHTLKGVAGSLGAEDLADQAARVEAGLGSQSAGDLGQEPLDPGAVQALANSLQALVTALAQALAAAEMAD